MTHLLDLYGLWSIYATHTNRDSFIQLTLTKTYFFKSLLIIHFALHVTPHVRNSQRLPLIQFTLHVTHLFDSRGRWDIYSLHAAYNPFTRAKLPVSHLLDSYWPWLIYLIHIDCDSFIQTTLPVIQLFFFYAVPESFRWITLPVTHTVNS